MRRLQNGLSTECQLVVTSRFKNTYNEATKTWFLFDFVNLISDICFSIAHLKFLK